MASTSSVIFVTQNRGKADEIATLLAGVPVRWERLPLAHVPGDDLEAAASGRVQEAFRRLGAPCFLENTGLWVHEHGIDEPPAFAPRAWKHVVAELGGEEAFCSRFGGAAVRARVAVAYASDEGTPRVFSGELVGQVAARPKGEGGYGWDRVVVPDGYARTLSELLATKYLTNMRLLPYLALAGVLRGRSYDGVFEAHVTIAAEDEATAARFAATCNELGVKFVQIELPRGVTRSQPMTASYHRGRLEAVQAEVLALGKELVRRGFSVTRTKIEAVGASRDVPETDEEAETRPPQNYFEYHVKVILPKDGSEDALAALRSLCEQHDAHLSRSARRSSQDTASQDTAARDTVARFVTRFVTQRAYRSGRVTSAAAFDALVAALDAAGFRTSTRLREYTVYDSNIGVDAGWMNGA